MSIFIQIIGNDHESSVPEFWYSDFLDPILFKFNYPILIIGETGTCRSVLAYAIHKNDPKKTRSPFYYINCNEIDDDSINEISAKKITSGTVFLDEIALLSGKSQIWLKAMLDTVFSTDLNSNVRIITGTKQDLYDLTNKNKFRRDLYHQLNIIPVRITPLRERKNTFKDLVNFIINTEVRKNNINPIAIDEEVIEKLINYPWPGNYVELQQTIKSAIVKCSYNRINVNDLPFQIKNEPVLKSKRGPTCKLNVEVVNNALYKTGGNKAMAAKILGVGRATLYRFLGNNSQIE